MKKEFLVNRQGKDFVLYAGLIDQAHREGLKRITTTLVQAPTTENGRLAIVHAQVETEKGIFDGIGDASPDNVGRMIAPHTVRMAETRAKARALRDAINVAVTAFEELGVDLDDSSPEQGQQAPLEGRKAARFGDDAPQAPQTPSRPVAPPPSAPEAPPRDPTPIPNSAVRRPAPPQRAPASPEPGPPLGELWPMPIPDDRLPPPAPMLPQQATEQQIQRIIKLSAACQVDLPRGDLSKLTSEQAAEALRGLSATFNQRSAKKEPAPGHAG